LLAQFSSLGTIFGTTNLQDDFSTSVGVLKNPQ
jgi:hypothetical protein